MDLRPVVVARQFVALVERLYPSNDTSAPTEKETLLAKELIQSLQNYLTDFYFEDDETLEENPDSQISSYSQELVVDDEGRPVSTGNCDGITIERKEEIVELVRKHPNWSIKTIQKKGAPEFRHRKYLARWEDQVKRGGTRFEQWKLIDKSTYEALMDLRCVKGSDIRLWALQAAQSFRDETFRFTASIFWISKFKEKHGISSRKITKLVSKSEALNIEFMQNSAAVFQQEIKELTPNFSMDHIINTHQAGFMHEIVSNRTLTHTGEKDTLALVKSPTNLATHSYTCQYGISMAGAIVGNVFLCLQEASGRIGPQVEKKLFKAQNVTLTCSKSGKLNTSLVGYYLDNVIVPTVKKHFLFVVDSWGGQTNANLYTDRFGRAGLPTCTLKIIPKNCTGLCQPLDTTFHRQLKYYARAIHSEYQLRYNINVNPSDEVTTRNNIVKMHSLLHNQLSAPIFEPMIKYSWFSAGLSDDKSIFKSVKEACFTFDDEKKTTCSNEMCDNLRFVKCSHCRETICFACFFYEGHFHFD